MKSVLQFSLYGLVMLSSGMLALAEGSGFPDAFTIPLALLALFVSERWNLFHLRVRSANVLGLVAFGVAGWELSSGLIEARLLSLAHLMVYLTWIVLFLPKSARVYWTLCLLSVLHVAIGAVLTSTGMFGLLCLVFLMSAIWTLTVFTVSRIGQRFLSEDEGLISARRPEPIVAAVSGSKPAAGFLWNEPSRPLETVQKDPRLRWISRPFVSGVFVNVLLSAVVGMLFFVFTPRIWVGNISAFGDAPDQPLRILQSGFAEEVQLGDIGQILEGTNTVLEVRMFDQRNNQPVDVVSLASQLGFDEPLFRGAVLGEYENGKWRVGTTGRQDGPRVVSPSPPDNCIRQEFRIEPMDSGILFAMPQHMAGVLEHRLQLMTERRVTAVLYRDDNISGREQLQYKIYSEKPRPQADRPFPRGTHFSSFYAGEMDYYLVLPSRLERLKALAEQIAKPAGTTDVTPTEMARRIVHYLRDSGEFGYTLDMSVTDPTIDAVEDFLFNRKQGHCEYFGSALGLMLRAVGIPTRMVSGFKGGDLNANTGYFVVQGRHAHVWVEALINGRWRVLDATPASRSDSVKSLAPKVSVFRELAQAFSDLWSHQVVGLSFNDQSSNLYTPLKDLGTKTWDELRVSFAEMLSDPPSGDESGRRGQRFVLGALVVVAVVLAMGMLMATRSRWATGPGWLRGLRRFLNWLFPSESATNNRTGWRGRFARWWSGLIHRLRGESSNRRRRVEFYERFLKLLQSAGLEPLPAQTAREFVTASQATWAEQFGAVSSTSLPVEVVTQFYRVRFGDESLSREELQQLDQQLGQLEQQWRDRNGRR